MYGKLQEEVNVDQPEGFIIPNNRGTVNKLKRALYGLCQPPRASYNKVHKYFSKHGSRRSDYEPSLYIKGHANNHLLACIYVDDIIDMGSSQLQVEESLNKK